MTDGPDRIAEIREQAEQYRGSLLVRKRPDSAIAHRLELLAEIDRLNRGIETLHAVGERQREQSRQLTHAPGACPTPCDDDCDAPCHEEHEVQCKRTHRPPRDLTAGIEAAAAALRAAAYQCDGDCGMAE